MTPKRCDWTLDLSIRCCLSIVEARLMTANQFTVIAGKNGSGKSQLLALASNRGGQYLHHLGYRSYFPSDQTVVSISGPERSYSITSARTIAKDVSERSGGAYSFAELEHHQEKNKYLSFRKTLSRFALQSDPAYSGPGAPRDPLLRMAKAASILTWRVTLPPCITINRSAIC